MTSAIHTKALRITEQQLIKKLMIYFLLKILNFGGMRWICWSTVTVCVFYLHPRNIRTLDLGLDIEGLSLKTGLDEGINYSLKYMVSETIPLFSVSN